MDSIIPLGQKNALVEYMILSGADNRPPMLDKDLVTRTKKYVKLSLAEKIQSDCDMKATNIILQGSPPNNQLRTSSNPRNQATIQDGKVTVQQVQGRQSQSYLGEGHMARQCTQPKQPRNASWYKDKAMLAEAHEDGQILDEEQLAFLANPGAPDGQTVQTIIPNNAAIQTKDLDTYDSDCDDISNAKAVLMANISNYGSVAILEEQADIPQGIVEQAKAKKPLDKELDFS
nr:hypothetical protein [Tanacetum cinerariifolium]